jgi:hypothetical protein
MTPNKIVCYKVLGEKGEAFHGGKGVWFLPTGKRPGEWMPKLADLVACQHGYHLCEGATDLVRWLGPTIWTAEWRGERIRSEDKIVVSQARVLAKCEHWNERTARLFAASCARDVLPIFEKSYPNDDRVRKCIEAVERFANGQVDHIFLVAARAAARAASGAAAWAAAWAAARAASGAASGAAAGAAAWAAAGAASGAAARAAARAASGAAAGAAAWAAAGAAQAKRLAHLLKTGEIGR